MVYSDFTLWEVKQRFQLAMPEHPDLFAEVPEAVPGPVLQANLADGLPLALAINTEKARSELIVAPILIEVRKQLRHRVSLFSGVDFSADPARGLNGLCDFILSGSPQQEFLTVPLVTIVEAKNDNPKYGLGQCAATMLGARIFNEREGNGNWTVHGASTSGTLWRFMRLEDNNLALDQKEYHISQLTKILGVLLYFLRPSAVIADSAA